LTPRSGGAPTHCTALAVVARCRCRLINTRVCRLRMRKPAHASVRLLFSCRPCSSYPFSSSPWICCPSTSNPSTWCPFSYRQQRRRPVRTLWRDLRCSGKSLDRDRTCHCLVLLKDAVAPCGRHPPNSVQRGRRLHCSAPRREQEKFFPKVRDGGNDHPRGTAQTSIIGAAPAWRPPRSGRYVVGNAALGGSLQRRWGFHTRRFSNSAQSTYDEPLGCLIGGVSCQSQRTSARTATRFIRSSK
jgi:hypothetical protein